MDEILKYFPLSSFKDVFVLFSKEIVKESPNNAGISVILGFIESKLTSQKKGQAVAESEDRFPIFEKDVFQAIYGQYELLVEECIKRIDKPISDSSENLEIAKRIKIKNISDAIWNNIGKRDAKDKLHVQSLYSLIEAKSLDCFGVALLVCMISQQIGLEDVHLALSEDHSWATFEGNCNKICHAEVAVVESKSKPNLRGQNIPQNVEKNWLYSGGKPVICDKKMEISAMVSALNPTISSKWDSDGVASLQQGLLWLLFDATYLERYPMAICNLADLEEISPSNGKDVTICDLYEKAIKIARTVYNNQHVYPYTYYGGYCFRIKMYEKALPLWLQASVVASMYCYSKDEEELYKEFHEITNTFLPIAIRCILNDLNEDVSPGNDASDFVAIITKVFKYYDNLFLWEQGSQTPVFHNEWSVTFVKILKLCIAKNKENFRNTVKVFEAISFKMNSILKNLQSEKPDYSTIKLQICSDASTLSVSTSIIKRKRTEEDYLTDYCKEIETKQLKL